MMYLTYDWTVRQRLGHVQCHHHGSTAPPPSCLCIRPPLQTPAPLLSTLTRRSRLLLFHLRKSYFPKEMLGSPRTETRPHNCLQQAFNDWQPTVLPTKANHQYHFKCSILVLHGQLEPEGTSRRGQMATSGRERLTCWEQRGLYGQITSTGQDAVLGGLLRGIIAQI